MVQWKNRCDESLKVWQRLLKNRVCIPYMWIGQKACSQLKIIWRDDLGEELEGDGVVDGKGAWVDQEGGEERSRDVGQRKGCYATRGVGENNFEQTVLSKCQNSIKLDVDSGVEKASSICSTSKRSCWRFDLPELLRENVVHILISLVEGQRKTSLQNIIKSKVKTAEITNTMIIIYVFSARLDQLFVLF